ncbi:MAG: hypothetical protein GDA44_14055 [Prochloron sp. SP5CPC1]|nr:hypothetical protein [Candidatus Paraprochloron terpiosi SP5CPC1]
MTQPNPDHLDRIESLLEHLAQDVEELKNEMIRTNDRVEIYQKASQQVVNLAFSLIITASLAIILPVILNR